MNLELLTIGFILVNALVILVTKPAFQSLFCWLFKIQPSSDFRGFLLDLLIMCFVVITALQVNLFLLDLVKLWK